MSALALLIGLTLTGQLGFADDRYPNSGAPPQADVAVASEENAAGTELVPLFDPPPGNLDTLRNEAPPTDEQFNPYVPQQPLGNNNQQIAPLDESTPASAAPPAGSPSTKPATRLKPSAMMRAMLTAPSDSQLAGEPVPLIEVLAGVTSRLEQSQRTEAYWDLCSSLADYYLGLREQQELRHLRNFVPTNQRAGSSPTPWEQAESELSVRIGTAQRAALTSQLRLANWLGRGPGNLPLPADAPHCGSYHSRYDEIFANRPTAEAQELAALLPLRHAELKDAALGVTRAEEWLDAVATLRNENSDGTGAVRALELLALRRRAFVQIARDYNRRIARYCELAAPGEIGAERLIGMLIKTEFTSTAARSASPTSAPGGQRNSVPGSQPQTFVNGEGWIPAGQSRSGDGIRDNAIQPTSGEVQQAPRQERSLLVKPR